MILHLASGSKTVLSPMCAALGGMVGQEVLKACSSKFMPIRQFLYLDAQEALPANIPPPSTDKPTRYLSQVAVFGPAVQEKICKLNYFLVGAGAIGCEMLKNWALMGVGCNGGKIYVTDMDRIEKSNLSRQFLFRNSDIDSFKSTTASKAAQAMNPAMDITTRIRQVGPETENVFGDSFYGSLDGICTALDNVEARLYVDAKCLFYRLPMLESGTLGTKGNTQIVVPHLTENYGATRDPPEKSIPVCTLKNFPNAIEHTLQWARDMFEGEFRQAAENAAQYLIDPKFMERANKLPGSQPIETLESVKRALVDHRPQSFEDCVTWARKHLQEQYGNQVIQLLHNFPPDQTTSSGEPFWSGPKRCPHPVKFDSKVELHLDYIVSAANLKAEVYGIPQNRDRAAVAAMVDAVVVPEFVPRSSVKIAVTDAEAEAHSNSVDSERASVLQTSIPEASSLGSLKLTP
jgi:ubiquitin-activating enzyme E1